MFGGIRRPQGSCEMAPMMRCAWLLVATLLLFMLATSGTEAARVDRRGRGPTAWLEAAVDRHEPQPQQPPAPALLESHSGIALATQQGINPNQIADAYKSAQHAAARAEFGLGGRAEVRALMQPARPLDNDPNPPKRARADEELEEENRPTKTRGPKPEPARIPPRAKLVAKRAGKVAPKARTFLQLAGQTHSEARAGVYPGAALGAAPNDARTARTTIRGGGVTDTATGLVRSAANPNGIFTLDASAATLNRVLRADFAIGAVGMDVGVAANEWCDTAWNSARTNGNFFTRGQASSRVHSIYHAGHIVARSFGGSDDPLNFLPLHMQTNIFGRWNSAEGVARAVKLALEAAGHAGCHVNVRVTFWHGNVDLGGVGQAHPALPAVAANLWVPSGGTYEVMISNVCWNHLTAVHPVGAPAAVGRPPTLRTFTNRAVTSAVRNAAHPNDAAVPAGRWVHRMTWTNGPDIPLQAAVANQGPEFVVDANLFP